MGKIDTGGDAYPVANVTDCYYGMTLLDYFAGQAKREDIIPYMYGDSWAMLKPTGLTREQAKYAYAAAMIAEKRRLETE